MGFMSLRYRRFKFSQIEAHEAPRDYNMLGNIMNDSIMAFTGYLMGHYMACDWIYKHRQYIIERLHFERDQGF